MDEALEFTRELAKATGETLLNYYHRAGIVQNLKTDRTVLTEADIAADEMIRSRIHEAYPQDGILSEEENTTYPSEKPFVWVVDPLDGTTNFSLGLHYWGVLINRLHEGMPILTVLYFPMLGELFTAAKGKGAFLNSKRLQITPETDTRKATFFSCCSRTHRNYHVEIPFKPRILGAAGYGLSTIARGSAVLALEVTPKVWDFTGSWLLTEETGGVIKPLDGDAIFPLQPGIDYGSCSVPLLVAPSEERWRYGRDRLHQRSKEP